jgi:hypothetical protein
LLLLEGVVGVEIDLDGGRALLSKLERDGQPPWL